MRVNKALCFLIISFSFSLSAHADSETSKLEKLFLEARYERAVSEAEGLIDARARKRYEIYYLKGLSELKLNRFSDARNTFQNIIDKYPVSPRIFDAYVGIGDSYRLEGRTASALRTYREILEKFPQDKNIAVVRSRIDERGAKTEEPGGLISVQVGSFKNRRNADKFARKLASAGFESFVEIPAGPADKLYRVKVGRLHSKEKAEELSARLKSKGYSTKICPAK